MRGTVAGQIRGRCSSTCSFVFDSKWYYLGAFKSKNLQIPRSGGHYTVLSQGKLNDIFYIKSSLIQVVWFCEAHGIFSKGWKGKKLSKACGFLYQKFISDLDLNHKDRYVFTVFLLNYFWTCHRNVNATEKLMPQKTKLWALNFQPPFE